MSSWHDGEHAEDPLDRDYARSMENAKQFQEQQEQEAEDKENRRQAYLKAEERKKEIGGFYPDYPYNTVPDDLGKGCLSFFKWTAGYFLVLIFLPLFGPILLVGAKLFLAYLLLVLVIYVFFDWPKNIFLKCLCITLSIAALYFFPITTTVTVTLASIIKILVVPQ